ncbi:antirestriction protein ArdA [Staphylococcus chromogenes]|uniref:antirestriction protein ArdA n=1 Tax=Staphylococcus chromogenes TaxID=46126 RepID=UPI0028876528|nr:antirestriction protein ArdA [Staphylococcus chromogenes]MDT0700402.1 antirestriction protein ArdA [Staphylococcus chromogenes]
MENVSRIYVTNLGKYNEGELLGQWLDLPATKNDFAKVLNNIGIGENYEEYFITDWEYMPKFMTEYTTDLNELNNMANVMTSIYDKIGHNWLDSAYLEDDFKFIVNSLCDYELYNNCDNNYEKLIEKIYDCEIFGSLSEFGEYLLEECNYLDYCNLDDEVKKYIDVEQLAYDTFHVESVIAVKTREYNRNVEILIV